MTTRVTYKRDPCDECTRRRCKLRPTVNKFGQLSCTKVAPPKSGWSMKELARFKGRSTMDLPYIKEDK